jgi:hypothetical protein
MRHLWDAYWAWVGGNIGAMPLQTIITVTATLLFTRPISSWWRKHFGAQEDLAEIRRAASAAHQIAADLFEHHTGRAHPAAPGDTESEAR